jgi:hypothetical protein
VQPLVDVLSGSTPFDHKPMVERRVVVHPDEIGGFARFQTIAQSAQSGQGSTTARAPRCRWDCHVWPTPNAIAS